MYICFSFHTDLLAAVLCFVSQCFAVVLQVLGACFRGSRDQPSDEHLQAGRLHQAEHPGP